jgi:hypothetical protein
MLALQTGIILLPDNEKFHENPRRLNFFSTLANVIGKHAPYSLAHFIFRVAECQSKKISFCDVTLDIDLPSNIYKLTNYRETD